MKCFRGRCAARFIVSIVVFVATAAMPTTSHAWWWLAGRTIAGVVVEAGATRAATGALAEAAVVRATTTAALAEARAVRMAGTAAKVKSARGLEAPFGVAPATAVRRISLSEQLQNAAVAAQDAGAIFSAAQMASQSLSQLKLPRAASVSTQPTDSISLEIHTIASNSVLRRGVARVQAVLLRDGAIFARVWLGTFRLDLETVEIVDSLYLIGISSLDAFYLQAYDNFNGILLPEIVFQPIT